MKKLFCLLLALYSCHPCPAQVATPTPEPTLAEMQVRAETMGEVLSLNQAQVARLKADWMSRRRAVETKYRGDMFAKTKVRAEIRQLEAELPYIRSEIARVQSMERYYDNYLKRLKVRLLEAETQTTKE